MVRFFLFVLFIHTINCIDCYYISFLLSKSDYSLLSVCTESIQQRINNRKKNTVIEVLPEMKRFYNFCKECHLSVELSDFSNRFGFCSFLALVTYFQINRLPKKYQSLLRNCQIFAVGGPENNIAKEMLDRDIDLIDQFEKKTNKIVFGEVYQFEKKIIYIISEIFKSIFSKSQSYFPLIFIPTLYRHKVVEIIDLCKKIGNRKFMTHLEDKKIWYEFLDLFFDSVLFVEDVQSLQRNFISKGFKQYIYESKMQWSRFKSDGLIYKIKQMSCIFNKIIKKVDVFYSEVNK